jgi:hypothetical protein
MMPVGTARVAYMRECRKRNGLKIIVIIYPNEQKLNAERQRECRKTHKNFSADL